jgi:NADPH:quinone reductase-like Zn-dependent oxidoreductase
MRGARVIISSRSDQKLERAKALGADDIEVGGTDTFAKSLRAVAVGGTVNAIGGVSGLDSTAPLREILSKMSLISGIFVGSRAMFEAMNRALARAQARTGH